VTLDDENIGLTKVTCTELSGSDDRPRLFTKEMVSRVSRPSNDVMLLDVEPEGFVWASEPKHGTLLETRILTADKVGPPGSNVKLPVNVGV
jgi:hypothetical protein